eukprot:m.86572 g.86572  ORF g.86572 m.86572 type:complete len:84 (-) comp14473_c3_seq2:39-290(-)
MIGQRQTDRRTCGQADGRNSSAHSGLSMSISLFFLVQCATQMNAAYHSEVADVGDKDMHATRAEDSSRDELAYSTHPHGDKGA